MKKEKQIQSFFEQLLKSNKRKSVIKEIYNENKEAVRDGKGILKIIREFYENLYASKHGETTEDSENMFLNELPKLSKENKEYCEGQIILAECYQAVKKKKWKKNH